MLRAARSLLSCTTAAAVAVTLAAPRLVQAQVSVTVSVGNASPYLADWATKPGIATLIINNTSGSALSATVGVRLQVGRALTVGTAGSDITTIPTSSSVYTTPQIARWTQMSISGLIADAYKKTGRLPEGMYILCVDLTNMMTASGGQVPDATGCTNFFVSYPQPPHLVTPFNGSDVTSPYPTFQWTPVAAPGLGQVDYLWRVVEVLPGQTALQALDANVPLHEAPLQNVTATIYPPSALPLENGKTYAWRVQAILPGSFTEGVLSPVGSNDGKSEIFTFKKKTAGIIAVQPPPPPPPPKPKQPPPSVVVPAGVLANASLSGKLEYTFAPSAVPAPQKVSVPYSGGLPILLLYENPPPAGWTPSQSGPLFTGGVVFTTGGPIRSPLAGAPLRLVVRYRTAKQAVIWGPIKAGGKVYNDVGKVVATATTGSDGSFAFAFHEDLPTGVVAVNTAISWGSGDVAFGSETGTLVRFYNLEVGDGHFLNSSDELTLGAGNTATVGTLVSLVRSYSVSVTVVRQKRPEETTPMVLAGVKVQLLRGYRPPRVPEREGPAPDWPRPTLSLPGMWGIPIAYEIIGEAETNAQGRVKFARLVKNVGPTDKYMVRVFTPEGGSYFYHTAMVSYAEAWPMLGPQGDAAVYNEHYDVNRTDSLQVSLVPRKARYVARLLREDSKQPLPYGRADLCYQYTCIKRYVEPADSGRFSFSEITPEKTTTPPFWRVDVGSYGFIPQSRNNLALLVGTQITNHEYYLVPDGYVRGRVVDEEGKPVPAHVQVDGGAWFATKPAFGNSKKQPLGYDLSPSLFQIAGAAPAGKAQAAPAGAQAAQPAPAQALAPAGGAAPPAAQTVGVVVPTGYVFAFNAVSGSHPLRIDAGPKYFPFDSTVSIAKKDTTDLGTLVVYRLKHRLRLRITGGPGKLALPGSTKPLPGAVVELLVSPTRTDTADAQGYVEFTWEAPVDEVTVRARGPADQDYVAREMVLQVPETKTWTQKSLHLTQGTRISGRVYAGGGDSVRVAGARVSLDLGGAILQAFTDSSGDYTLRSVPVGQRELLAGKSVSNFIGDTATVDAKVPAVTGVDFHLRYYEAINITRLLGFKLEVHDLVELPGGRARIRGALVDPPDNAVFTADPTVTALTFDSVTIESDGSPEKRAVAVAGHVVLANNELDVDPWGNPNYVVRQYAPATGLRVRAPGSGGSGAVYGPIEVNAVSFTNVTSAEIDSMAVIHLLQPGATGDARIDVASLTADSSAPVGTTGFNVGTATGGALRFRLYGFRADADSAGSYLRADAMHLKTRLHTEIPGVPDLALAINDLVVAPGTAPTGGVKPASDSVALSFKLGYWTVQATSWYLSPAQGRVYLAEGKVLVPPDTTKPASTVQFPFTAMQVTPTTLSGGNFGGGPVLLAGFVPLTPAAPIEFVQEGTAGPWKLVALGGEIAGLPGMDAGQHIEIESFSFGSNGQSGLTPKSDAQVRYYHTADFTVKAIGVTETTVQLNGNLDINVPNLGPQGFIFTYTKVGGKPQLAPPPLTFQAFDIGGASLTLTNGTLDSTGFKSGGSLHVTGKWTVPINFSRTPLNGTNQIAAVPVPGSDLAIGQVSVNDVTGGSKVTGGAWSTKLDGQLDVSGQAGGAVSFSVEGANVNVGTAGLQVKNISTPFGNVTITLNFPEERLEGFLEVNKEIASGTSVQGSAELAISGKASNRYWYFFAGANFTMSSPTLGGTAAILIGDAQLSGTLLDKFAAYSTKGVPAAFHDIDGFFLEGKVVVPVPICPNGSFDVGIASVAVWCSVWGDIRLGMNFQELNTYHVGAQVGVEVGAKGGVGLGVCLHVSGKVALDAGIEGEYRSDGAWYALGEMNFSLHGEVSGGVGIDDACIDKSAGFTLQLGAEAQKGYNWNTNKDEHITIWVK